MEQLFFKYQKYYPGILGIQVIFTFGYPSQVFESRSNRIGIEKKETTTSVKVHHTPGGGSSVVLGGDNPEGKLHSISNFFDNYFGRDSKNPLRFFINVA